MQSGVIYAAQPYGLGLNETLMPQYLKELGYATHGVGKVCHFFLLVAAKNIYVASNSLQTEITHNFR